MTSSNVTAADRHELEGSVASARYELGEARERLMDEDNDGADYSRIDRAEQAMTAAIAALSAFDAAYPEVLAAKREAAEPARLDALRRLRADEGLTKDQADELAALEAKHGKHYLDMTPEEQAAQRTRNADAQAAKDAAFWGEWTPETTAARKAAWNAGLEARGIVRGQKPAKSVNAYAIQSDLERQFGFRFDDLKRAIAKHFPK